MIIYPKFDPSTKIVEKTNVIDFLIHGMPTSHQHDMVNFLFFYEKNCLRMVLFLNFW